MDPRHLRSFLSLAKTGSLVRASEEMFLSPAAVYKQLKNLESELGVNLYRRYGRKVQLTHAGEALVPAATSLLTQHQKAAFSVREAAGNQFVRIGTGPAASSYLLPCLLRKFRQVSPNAEIVVESGHTSDLISRLGQGSLNLVLAHSFPHVDRSVCVEKSWRVEFVIVSGTPQPQPVASLRDLNTFRFVLFREGSETQIYIDRYLQRAGYKPKVLTRFDNSQSVKEMVLAKSGLGILPFWIVDAEIRKRELFLVHLSEPRFFIPLVLLSRGSSSVQDAVEAFIRLAQTFKWSRPRLISPGDSASRPGVRRNSRRGEAEDPVKISG